MEVQSKNRSSEKTRKLIRQTFAELIAEKHSIDHISVTELCERANITRGTFYFHYENLADVADDFREEIFTAFFEQPLDFRRPSDIERYFDQITQYLQANVEIYRMLASASEIPDFTNHLAIHLRRSLLHYLQKYHPGPSSHLRLDAEFFTDGAIGLLVRFFREDTQLSLDDINRYLKLKFYQTFQ